MQRGCDVKALWFYFTQFSILLEKMCHFFFKKNIRKNSLILVQESIAIVNKAVQ